MIEGNLRMYAQLGSPGDDGIIGIREYRLFEPGGDYTWRITGETVAAYHDIDRSLIEAAKQGDLLSVQDLIDSGADVNVSELDGATLIAWAISNGEIELLRLILKEGADVNMISNERTTPLWLAVNRQKIEIIESLISAGADLNFMSEMYRTPLEEAIKNNNIDIVQILITAGADLNLLDWVEKSTPLMLAVVEGKPEIAELLTASGADVNSCSWNGITALMNVAYRGDINMIKLLIEAGADPNAETREGVTALIDAADEGNTEAVMILRDLGAEINPQSEIAHEWFYYAMADGDYEIAQCYISAGINPDYIFRRDGTSLLGYAIMDQDPDMIKLLIEAGADVEKQDLRGLNALAIAREDGNEEIMELIETAGDF